jgi:predicted permease
LGFSLLVVFTLSLGIGITTALFSVVDAVLLRPLAYRNPGQIVAINTRWPAKNRTSRRITGGDFIDLRTALHSVSSMAFYNGGEMGVRVGAHSQFARTFQTSPSLFHVLDVTPVLGRLPEQSDAKQSAVVTVSFAAANWGNPAKALGQAVTVDNKAYQVVGLIDDRFSFPEKADLWITGPMDPENRNHSAFNYFAIARLRPGVDVAAAQAELSTVSTRLAHGQAADYEGKAFRVLSLQEDLTGQVRTTLLCVFGAAGLLLLISSANAANLMQARAAARHREIAVRLSLGSNVGGIARLLLAEGAVLGCAAAAGGLLLAYVTVHALSSILPANLPHAAADTQLNASALLFAAAVSAIMVLACSLLPLLNLRKVDIAEVLKQAPGGRVVGAGARSRDLIVIGQIALCCILCVGAALLSRTLLALIHAPLGYNSQGILVMYADSPAFEMAEYLQAIRTFESALDDIRQVAGVRAAAAVMGLPTGRYGSNGSYLVEGVHIQPGQDPFKANPSRELPEAVFALASPRYFETVGIPMLAGRDFSQRDQYNAPFTVIISQSLARQSFGSSDPIGRRIYCGLDSPKPMTIVGVVGDVRQDSPASNPEPEIYMPFQQHPSYANELQVVVRADGDATRLTPEIRRRMQRLAPTMATSFESFPDMVQDSMAAPRFRATLVVVFAGLAVLLAMTGVYSLMAYVVAQRTSEMGLRMALGAGRTHIMGLVFRYAFALASVGLVVGLTGAVLLSRFVGSLLYGVRALDVVTYCSGALAVLLVVVMASSVPAWRACRVDPAGTLREN